MDPERLSDWLVVLQNAGVFCIGAFLLLYEVVFRAVPDATAMGAGVTLLLAAPARAWVHKRRKNGHNGGEADETEEKWSHLR